MLETYSYRGFYPGHILAKMRGDVNENEKI